MQVGGRQIGAACDPAAPSPYSTTSWVPKPNSGTYGACITGASPLSGMATPLNDCRHLDARQSAVRRPERLFGVVEADVHRRVHGFPQTGIRPMGQ